MKKEELIKSLKNQKFPERIIRAFEEVNRSKFVLKREKRFSYEDIALPIGEGQTISQPYTIAFMLALLEVKDKQKILEVGSGSGYVLELLSKLNPNGKIFGIERIKKLAESSKEKLKNCKNIKVICGDGSKGFKRNAPYDRILTSAAANKIPQKLIEQLIIWGILVAPVMGSIIVVKKDRKKNKVREFPGFRFVPLIAE
ncbi:protein-L-isoaspartate(D-aspartate) O-methyltransferase [Candidatus Pacearchaeota archaeon]|nr:protein-L-isoaspartate(D-aspartate) O-methyltransferase [Candidatus Pacearchaeota archaeon]